MKQAIGLTEFIGMVPDGACLMIGGFMGVGAPLRLIDALVESDRTGLTIISNDTSWPDRGVGKLISARKVAKVITSHIGLNPETQRQMIDREIEVELVPQGTLVECIRAGGFGLGGVLTKTGLGTPVEDDKQTVDIDGETFLLEKPLRADFALIHAKSADYVGNLSYSLTAQNLNPVMAMAADTVIVEAQEIVPVGMITPDAVKTPGVLVDHLLERAA
ncbi:MAG: 3-oxoacid CoA-transferase subunit A [Alphaproteobacteria bacterium]